MHPTFRDGHGMQSIKDNSSNFPNYFPNSFFKGGCAAKYLDHADHFTGDVTRYDTGDDDNFSQPTIYWTNNLNDEERQRLVNNIAGHARNAARFLQERVVKLFAQVHPDFGDMLSKALKEFQVC